MASDLFFFDTETYSETPLQRGTHAYAVGAEIMVCSWASGMEEKAKVADLTNDFGIGTLPFPEEVLDALATPWVQIVGANFGNFDRTLLRYARGIVVDPERIIDTQVQALSHGLPGGLDKLGEIFNVLEEDAKIKEGKALMMLFCKPRPKNMKLRRATRLTHPAEWARYLEYARTDVIAMREVWKKLPSWNYGAQEVALWHLDQMINDRGYLIDVEFAGAALVATDREQELLGSFGYSSNTTYLHRDAAFLPEHARSRASWNYRLEDCGTLTDRTRVTYWMNRLQAHPESAPLLVTLKVTDSGTS